jgi:hypothetical protein
MYVCINASVYACTTPSYTYTSTHKTNKTTHTQHTCMHKHTHTQTHAHIHTHTHTHTLLFPCCMRPCLFIRPYALGKVSAAHEILAAHPLTPVPERRR